MIKADYGEIWAADNSGMIDFTFLLQLCHVF
jgi:hypothetical protein